MVSRFEIFNSHELKFINRLYQFLEPRIYIRYVNLGNVERRDVPEYFYTNSKEWANIVTKLENTVNSEKQLKVRTCYFLRYIQKSFTAIHVDNPQTTAKTAVTLLDVSTGLVGGDIIIQRKANKDDFFKEQDSIGGNSKKLCKPNHLDNITIPEIIKQDVGETIIYDNNLHHGVTRVHRGHRLVLITWFKENEKDQIYKETI